MLSAQGFGSGQAPFDGELADYTVLRGVVIGSPKQPGDKIKLNPKSNLAIELSALGKIELDASTEKPVNRAVGVQNGAEKLKKRGKK